MVESKTSDSSTAYDPFLISEHQEGGGLSRSYTDAMADKQGFVAVGEAVPAEDSSGKGSKSSHQFHELEVPRPQSAMPVKSHSRRWAMIAWAIKYYLTIILVAMALAIPIIVFRQAQLTENDTVESAADKQYRQLVFYLFLWLLITWLSACASDMFILAFPYIFRFVAGYINPAHQRYWRIFRALRKPVVLVGCISGSYTSFQFLVNQNNNLIVNFNKDPNYWGWDDIVYDVLQQMVFWMVGYLLVRILVLYISVHYHYRSDQVQITHSKEMHQALVTLYEASIYLHPVNSRHFVLEDSIIRNSSGSGTESTSRQSASELLRKVGMDGHSIAHFFGNFKSQQHSHWLHPSAPYAVVERALSHPKSAAALAKRIWMSLVVQGREAFSAEDIAEVLGPYRRDEALDIFKVIDENESGDIRLDEMVWTVVEAGRIRHSIYQTMADINHCINTFDWIALLVLAALMIFFILLLYVPTIKDIQTTAGYLAIGMAFAVGRTVHKYLVGCIFVFFEHPFDIGDRVNIYNMTATVSVSATAIRQSLLYTVFRRVDNGTDIQITNERLAMKRIENISRSGVNKQALTFSVDFKTSFNDIMFLRSELESFLKENNRDYQPTLGLSVVSLHDLDKLELLVSFTHKSNWSNERLRASRSSKFMCALVAATRKIPLYRPNASKPILGDDARPMYTVKLTGAEAAAKAAADKKKREEVRIDAVEKEVDAAAAADEAARMKAEKAKAEVEAEEAARKGLTKVPVVQKPTTHDGEEDQVVQVLLQHRGTGLRTSVSGPAGMFHQVG